MDSEVRVDEKRTERLRTIINDLRVCGSYRPGCEGCSRNHTVDCGDELNNDAAMAIETLMGMMTGCEAIKPRFDHDILDAKPEVNGNDGVAHPAYYNSGSIEVWDAIADWGLGEGFVLGNVIKYVARAGRKDGNSRLKDLNKAREYIDKAIALEKAGKL